MIKKSLKKGFTLIEILASIAILAVIILMVTISYSKIRKSTLNKQYENLKTLIEQAAIKYSSKNGSFSFFVQELINENYIEPDDEDKVYDPRDKSPLNCHLVTISDDEDIIKATLSDDDHTQNGECNYNDVEVYSSLLTLSAKLEGTETGYTATSTVNGSGVYPLIYNGWTKYNITITPDLSQITEDVIDSHIVWNNNPENVTYYPGLDYTTHESVIFDQFYYADLYLTNNSRFQARLKYKMDNENPIIYHDKTVVANSTGNDGWTKSKVVILYVTDKDGVGLDRVYVGPESCNALLTNRNLGQAAIPGMVQTYVYNGEVSDAGVNANVCAVDKLGNLADAGQVYISKVDSLPPDVDTILYYYDEQVKKENLALYTEDPITTIRNQNVSSVNIHTATSGWTNTGHMYRFNVTDGGSGLANDDKALWAYHVYTGDYTQHTVADRISALTPKAAFSTTEVKVFSTGISGKGKRLAKFSVCDNLGNCRTIQINDNIDKDGPKAPTMNFINGDGTVYNENKWTKNPLYVARSSTDSSPQAQDVGSGLILKYQIATTNTSSTVWTDYSYNSSSDMYKLSAEGIHYRYFRAIDIVGNVGAVKKVEGKIDLTAPRITSFTRKNSNDNSNYTGSWIKYNVVATLNYEDDLSGIDKSSARWKDNKGTPNYTTSTGSNQATESSYKETWTGEGERVAYQRICDNAGNCSEDSFTLKIDKQKPTCGNKSGEGSSSNWVNTSRKVTVACSDNGGSLCEKTSFDKTFTDERTTGTIEIKDTAGNTESCTVNVYIDLTKPVISSFSKKNSDDNSNYTGNWVNHNVIATLNYSDALSGIDKSSARWKDNAGTTSYATSGGTNQATESSYTETWTGEGNRTAYQRICDRAGNCSESSFTLKIDKTPPNVSSFTTKYSNGTTYSSGWTNQSVISKMVYDDKKNNVTLSGIDASSAGWSYDNSTYYHSGSGATNATTTEYSETWNTEGDKTRYQHICDNAGNCAEKHFNLKLDKTPPNILTKKAYYSGTTEEYDGTWTNTNIERKITYDDKKDGTTLSGIDTSKAGWSYDGTSYNHSDGALNATTTTYTEWFGAQGTRTAYQQICDNAGNCSSTSFTVKIDKTPPVMYINTYDYSSSATNHVGTLRWESTFTSSATLNVNDLLSTTPLGYKTFRVTASDSMSGLVEHIDWYRDIEYNHSSWPSQWYLRNDDSDSFPYYNNFNVDGYRVAEAVVQDVAGNETRVTIMSATNVGSSSGSGSGGSGGSGSGGSCTPDMKIGMINGSAAANTCTKGYKAVTEFGRMDIFGCKNYSNVDGTYSESSFGTYFRNGIKCVTNSSGNKTLVPPTSKMKAMDQNAYYGYYCSSDSTSYCNGTKYASNCTSTDGYYRYQGSTRYKCTTFRNGSESALAVNGQTESLFMCCK